MDIGKRIYYDITTGVILIDTGERAGSVVATTPEQDLLIYKALMERVRDSFDYIELEYGQFAQDFIEGVGYRVNPQTKQLEFSYPEPGEIPPEPVYQTPLSVEVANLRELVDAMLGVTN